MDQVANGTGRVLLGLEGSGDVGKLLAVQDVELVICGVTAGVALGADSGIEDDQVLSDTLKKDSLAHWSGTVGSGGPREELMRRARLQVNLPYDSVP